MAAKGHTAEAIIEKLCQLEVPSVFTSFRAFARLTPAHLVRRSARRGAADWDISFDDQIVLIPGSPSWRGFPSCAPSGHSVVNDRAAFPARVVIDTESRQGGASGPFPDGRIGEDR